MQSTFAVIDDAPNFEQITDGIEVVVPVIVTLALQRRPERTLVRLREIGDHSAAVGLQ
jgi:hypothetical protein